MTARARARQGAHLLSALVLAVLLLVGARRLDLSLALAELATVRPLWVVSALLCYAAILPLWAVQWCLLAPSPRPRLTAMLGVVSMTSAILNTTPMLVGEAAGVVLLVARTGLARAAAVSVLAMDQLLVGVAKVAVLTLAALALRLPPAMARGLTVLVVAVGALLGTLLAAAWQPRSVARFAWRALPPRLARALSHAAVALEPLRCRQRGGGALLIALAKKGAELVAIFSLQRAFGVSLPLASSLLVLAALNLATLLPVVPGNVGVYEAAVVFAYTRLGIPAERALGIAVLQHACYFVALAVPGYPWLARSVPLRSSAAAS